MRKVYNVYADLETTVGDKPQVYSWAVGFNKKHKLSSITNNSTKNKIGFNPSFKGMKAYYGFGIESFITFAEAFNKDVIMWFNNSRGFDAHFILPELDKEGYIQKPEFPEDYKKLEGYFKKLFWGRVAIISERLLKEDPSVKDLSRTEKFKKIKRNWNLLLPKEYSLVVDNNHKILEIKIGLENEKRSGKARKYRALIIRDNLSLFPTSIAGAGSMLSKIAIRDGFTKAEAEEEYLKKELKPDAVNGVKQKAYNRTKLYSSLKELEQDGNELDYLLQDVYILYKFQEYMSGHFDTSKWKMTIASTSYNEWLATLGMELIEKGLAKKTITIKKQTKGGIKYVFGKRTYSAKKLGLKLITKILPTEFLSEENSKGMTFYEALYQWYRGGITHVNEAFRGQFMEMITFLDINSSYPSQMIKDALVPYGEIFEGNRKENDFKFYKLTPLKPIRNKSGLPFLFSSTASKREYVKTLIPMETYRFTSCLKDKVDKFYLDGVNKSHYRLEIEYSSKSIPIKTFFEGYIGKWYKIKEEAAKNGDSILKFIAKLFLNSLYGKFGTKDFRESRIWNQETQTWEKKEEYVKPTHYLPLAIAIVELAVGHLVEGVGDQYKNFIYCDTDSIAVINFDPKDYKGLELNPTKLGAWDIEFDKGYGIFRRPKQYFIRNDKSSKLAFAGINFNKWILSDKELAELSETEAAKRQLTLLDYVNGTTIGDQTKPKRILGYGVLIEEIDKEIKPLWSFKPNELLTEQKFFRFEDFKETIKKLSKLPKSDIIYLHKN